MYGLVKLIECCQKSLCARPALDTIPLFRERLYLIRCRGSVDLCIRRLSYLQQKVDKPIVGIPFRGHFSVNTHHRATVILPVSHIIPHHCSIPIRPGGPPVVHNHSILSGQQIGPIVQVHHEPKQLYIPVRPDQYLLLSIGVKKS